MARTEGLVDCWDEVTKERERVRRSRRPLADCFSATTRPPRPHPVGLPLTAQAQAALAGRGEVVGIRADLQPGTLLAAYRCGLFPMPAGNKLAWWSPDPRGVVPLDGLAVSRSLRRSCQRFEIPGSGRRRRGDSRVRGARRAKGHGSTGR